MSNFLGIVFFVVCYLFVNVSRVALLPEMRRNKLYKITIPYFTLLFDIITLLCIHHYISCQAHRTSYIVLDSLMYM